MQNKGDQHFSNQDTEQLQKLTCLSQYSCVTADAPSSFHMSMNFIVPALKPLEAVCKDAGERECYSQRKLLPRVLIFYEHTAKSEASP